MDISFDPYEKQKESAGKFAAFVWIGAGVYLYLTSDEVTIVSWSAFLFFAVGLCAAAVVFGLAVYGVQRCLARGLTTITPSAPSTGTVAIIRLLGMTIMMIEAVVIFIVASEVFELIKWL